MSSLSGSIASIDAANKSKKAAAKAAKASISTANTPGSSSSTIIKKTKIVWTDEEIDLLCDYLQEARDKGMWEDNGFKASAYAYVASKLEDSFKTGGNQGPVQTKWTRIKKDYVQIKSLLDTSGFGWNDENKISTAKDVIWEEIAKTSLTSFYLFLSNFRKDHSEKIKWRTTLFPWLYKIMKMLGESLAIEEHRFYNGLDEKDILGEDDDLEGSDNDNDNNIQSRQDRRSQAISFILVSATPSSRQLFPRPFSSASNKRRFFDLLEISSRKKGKISDSSTLESIGYGIEMIAQSFNKESESQKEQIDTTLAGQTTIRI